MITSRLKLCFCLILLCSIGQIAYSTPLLPEVSADTLRPLETRGVFLTYGGFRLVLDERIRLLQCEEIVAAKDTALKSLLKENQALQYNNQLLRANDAVLRQNEKYFKKKLFWKNLSSGLGWTTAAVLAFRLIVKG